MLNMFVVFGMFCSASAFAGHIYRDIRAWAVAGPGGYYGVVEYEGVPVAEGGHTLWETQFLRGPLYFTLPYRAPVAVAFLAVVSAVLGSFAVRILLGIRKHASGHTKAPNHDT